MERFGPPGGLGGGLEGSLGGMGVGDSSCGTILAVVYTTTAVMFSILCLRLYVRWRYSGIRLDDWAHVAASCFAIAAATVMALSVRYGLGRHKLDINPIETIHGLKWNWILNLMFIITTFVVRLAICSSLLYLAWRDRIFRFTIYGLMVFMITYSVAFWLPTILECQPQKFIYDKISRQDGECLPVGVMRGLEIMHTLMNSATGAVLVGLLVAIQWGRVMEEKLKYGPGVVVLLGLFAIGASIARSFFVFRYSRSDDTLYDSKNLSICAIIEINLGIIASCVGCLQPLLRPHHVSLTNIAVVDPSQADARGSGLSRRENEKNFIPPPPLPPMNPMREMQRERLSGEKGPIYYIEVGEVHPAFRPRMHPLRNVMSLRGDDRGSGIDL